MDVTPEVAAATPAQHLELSARLSGAERVEHALGGRVRDVLRHEPPEPRERARVARRLAETRASS